jgi:hypothetical protein
MAEILGVTERSVERYRRDLGLTREQVYPWTDEELRRARELLDDECPYAEVSRTLGISVPSLQSRFPGRGHRGNPLGHGRHMRLAEALGLGLSWEKTT